MPCHCALNGKQRLTDESDSQHVSHRAAKDKVAKPLGPLVPAVVDEFLGGGEVVLRGFPAATKNAPTSNAPSLECSRGQ